MTKAQTAISFMKWAIDGGIQYHGNPLQQLTATELYDKYYQERQARLAKARETPDQSAAEDHLDYLESKW